MNNLVKMELYKLRTSKLFLALLCICAVLNAALAAGGPLLTKFFSPKQDFHSDLSAVLASPFYLGLLMVFLFVSAVSFLYQDFSDGYIKNIAGQVSNRSSIVFAKFIALAVHNMIFFIAVVLSNILGTAIAGALVIDGNIAGGILTLLIKWLLSMALCSILMFFAVGLKSKTFATILGVIFPLGALSLLYVGIDTLLMKFLKLGGGFSISNYMPDTLISSVNVIYNVNIVNSVIVALVYTVLFCILTNFIFKKRDIK